MWPAEHRLGDHLERRLGRPVDHEVSQARVPVLADGGIEADRVTVVVQQLGQGALLYLQRLGQLGECGGPAVLGLELALHTPGTTDLVADVGRDADGVGRVLDRSANGLADPPSGVRGELETLAPVELLDRMDQAEVALLDEVRQRQARTTGTYGRPRPRGGGLS